MQLKKILRGGSTALKEKARKLEGTPFKLGVAL